MADPYAGQPRHLVMANAPTIEITHSDCDNAYIQEYATFGNVMLPKADETTRSRFLRRTATMLMYDAKFWEGLKNGMVFEMPRFPAGYELYLSEREDQEGDKKGTKDRYLFGGKLSTCPCSSNVTNISGFKSDGTRIVFRSSFEFVMHAKWLAYGCPWQACRCKYCSGAPQNEISKHLKEVTKHVKWTNKPFHINALVKRRKNGSRPERRSKRIRGKDYKDITAKAKDYTKPSGAAEQVGPH